MPFHLYDPKLDLQFEREVDLPREIIWQAWTTPALLKHWFTPAPWKTVDCEIDLRPGGIFSTLMQSPEGQQFPNVGCYLEIVPHKKLVWTNALAPGYRPAQPAAATLGDEFFFTAVIALETQGSGTKYTARVIHGNEEARNKHEGMGFEAGWGKAFEQLVACVRKR